MMPHAGGDNGWRVKEFRSTFRRRVALVWNYCEQGDLSTGIDNTKRCAVRQDLFADPSGIDHDPPIAAATRFEI
jgi:hypothetical protein